MSLSRNNSHSSNHGTKTSSLSQKKSSFLVRFIKGTFFQIFVFFTTIILLGVGYAAWTTLDRNDAANGKPVTQTLMQGIIDNINDLNTRLIGINPSGTILKGSILQLGNKYLRPGLDTWIRLGDVSGDYNGQGLAADKFWSSGSINIDNGSLCFHNSDCKNSWPKAIQDQMYAGNVDEGDFSSTTLATCPGSDDTHRFVYQRTMNIQKKSLLQLSLSVDGNRDIILNNDYPGSARVDIYVNNQRCAIDRFYDDNTGGAGVALNAAASCSKIVSAGTVNIKFCATLRDEDQSLTKIIGGYAIIE